MLLEPQHGNLPIGLLMQGHLAVGLTAEVPVGQARGRTHAQRRVLLPLSGAVLVWTSWLLSNFGDSGSLKQDSH